MPKFSLMGNDPSHQALLSQRQTICCLDYTITIEQETMVKHGIDLYVILNTFLLF